MDWLMAHADALNLALNAGMFAVWVFYLQLFLWNYLRARKPRLLINRGKGSDLEALCLVSNMSQEPVYPLNVYFTLDCGDESCRAAITDRDLLAAPADDDPPRDVTSHGPLTQGDFMSIGSFRHMLDLAVKFGEGEPRSLEDLRGRIRTLEVMVTGAFGGDDLEIAARRTFRVVTDREPWTVVPTEPQTRQISSRRERRKLRRMAIDDLARDEKSFRGG
ncbi:hypothetical protein [Wenxinia saemankumensis]|uniref:Uncharacterized protein n=1 Tax=Wenxinia saemankumensis TaxID=1447782 RepID=A0A1M6FN40_9RHOB|nr:hypothetical protein [Wenxinia saemankumensis]SHI99085.1 hypothetical protein SAMN05444417_2411 [Wenxinia saemankumensis]